MPKKLFHITLPILLITIFLITQTIRSASSEEPIETTPSLTLLNGGTAWAAKEGKTALYVDWWNNYLAHHETDGADWGPWPTEADMKNWTHSIAHTLNQSGFNVNLTGDIPDDLSSYDVVILQAYWAMQPKHEPLIREYLANGGGVVLLSGVTEYVRCYCKDWWTYCQRTDEISKNMSEWVGANHYANSGGYANVTVDNPFGTDLMAGDPLADGTGYSCAAMLCPHNDTQVVAQWEYGCIYAYAHEYGLGRVYYQASFECTDREQEPFAAPETLLGTVLASTTILLTLGIFYTRKSKHSIQRKTSC